jgi:hypothetical protein
MMSLKRNAAEDGHGVSGPGQPALHAHGLGRHGFCRNAPGISPRRVGNWPWKRSGRWGRNTWRTVPRTNSVNCHRTKGSRSPDNRDFYVADAAKIHKCNRLLDMMLDLGGEALFRYRGSVATRGRAGELLRDGAFLRSIGPELPLGLSPGG